MFLILLNQLVMKYKIHIYIALLILIIISCEDDGIYTPGNFNDNLTNKITVELKMGDVYSMTAFLFINLDNPGQQDIDELGYIWGSKNNDDLSNHHVIIEPSLYGSTHTIVNLMPETQYFAKAYIIKNLVTIYSREITFTTDASEFPIIITSEVTDIKAESAICGGAVLYEGRSPVIARGVVWDIHSKPTIEASPATGTASFSINGSGKGKFSSYVNNLNPGTTYYIRAYVKNENGFFFFGEERSFVTDDPTDRLN